MRVYVLSEQRALLDVQLPHLEGLTAAEQPMVRRVQRKRSHGFKRSDPKATPHHGLFLPIRAAHQAPHREGMTAAEQRMGRRVQRKRIDPIFEVLVTMITQVQVQEY